jgi:hypothetical protein
MGYTSVLLALIMHTTRSAGAQSLEVLIGEVFAYVYSQGCHGFLP